MAVPAVLDQSFFKDEMLARAIEDSVSRYFPAQHDDLVVTLRDNTAKAIFSSQAVEDLDDEAAVKFDYVFNGWTLGIRMRSMTGQQWADRSFALNLTLVCLMTLILIGGMVLALRAASREMKLSQMKSDFVSNVSHELRTPLASIRVFGEFFKRGMVKDPDKMREYGNYIETESRRLTQLINNILDFSRIESGQKSYHFEPSDVGELIAETLNIFEVRLKQDDFVIVFGAPSHPLPAAMIDSEAITQAFVNLVDNAVKYSGSSRVIRVRVRQESCWITISVTDHGIGIPTEDQKHIFERFHRVSTGLVHEVRGSGLGLAIVKHIVEAHRGKITVQSTPGAGSTFTIHLPVADAAQSNFEAESKLVTERANDLAG